MAVVERVLVVGGGPAGLVAATRLGKRGVSVDVIEVNDHLRPLGSGLTMMGPTLRAMHQADGQAARACISQGAGYDFFVFADAAGNVLHELPLPHAAEGLPGGFGIMRPIFWGLLAEMAEREATRVEMSTTVESIEQDAGGVDVVLSSGERRRYDLVVGADGLHSKVRALIFPDAPEPRYNGQTVWRAVGAGIAVEDGVVLGEVVESEPSLEQALKRFMERRFERARIVVENSAQLSAWEQDPSVPASEHARLSDESFAALAQPI